MLVEDLDRKAKRREDILLRLPGFLPSPPRDEEPIEVEATAEAGLDAELSGQATQWVHEGETPSPEEVTKLIRQLQSGTMTMDQAEEGWV